MPKTLPSEYYLSLKEKGIDINTCELDFKKMSVSCEDLILYRKALRVKIRSLIKLDDVNELKHYVNALYSLACFSKYLYGFHSCCSKVNGWQEELSHKLQIDFDEDKLKVYTPGLWISYKETSYRKDIGLKYNIELDLDTCIQDKKPFLNLKDKAHFDKCFKNK
ncbi:MAG TPA: hypothetical protein EYO73_04240 [Sulfurimonas sp.]|nr:hypothetical protein [Sulfurimonas sp.]